jgi:hypothetical protein
MKSSYRNKKQHKPPSKKKKRGKTQQARGTGRHATASAGIWYDPAVHIIN